LLGAKKGLKGPPEGGNPTTGPARWKRHCTSRFLEPSIPSDSAARQNNLHLPNGNIGEQNCHGGWIPLPVARLSSTMPETSKSARPMQWLPVESSGLPVNYFACLEVGEMRDSLFSISLPKRPLTESLGNSQSCHPSHRAYSRCLREPRRSIAAGHSSWQTRSCKICVAQETSLR